MKHNFHLAKYRFNGNKSFDNIHFEIIIPKKICFILEIEAERDV